jgi:hypothetical protein
MEARMVYMCPRQRCCDLASERCGNPFEKSSEVILMGPACRRAPLGWQQSCDVALTSRARLTLVAV